MTGMLAAQRDGVIARRMATLPATLSTEDQAALIGRQDAARPGARLRLFLSARPRLRSAARIIFGLGSQNGLADARLEAIRQGALLAALGRWNRRHAQGIIVIVPVLVLTCGDGEDRRRIAGCHSPQGPGHIG